MTNWCNNTLTITGPSEEVDQFIKDNSGDEGETLVFSKAVPEPTYEGYTDSSSKTSPSAMPDWYHWRIGNWGTKWEPEIFDLTTSTKNINNQLIKTVSYDFRTPWSPGNAWCQKAIEKYPKLRFCLIYGEIGADFSGVVVGANGEVIKLAEGRADEYLTKENTDN